MSQIKAIRNEIEEMCSYADMMLMGNLPWRVLVLIVMMRLSVILQFADIMMAGTTRLFDGLAALIRLGITSTNSRADPHATAGKLLRDESEYQHD